MRQQVTEFLDDFGGEHGLASACNALINTMTDFQKRIEKTEESLVQVRSSVTEHNNEQEKVLQYLGLGIQKQSEALSRVVGQVNVLEDIALGVSDTEDCHLSYLLIISLSIVLLWSL